MNTHVSQVVNEFGAVGPGTVVGEFMRQYWIPAARCEEVEAGGTPLRLLLLGERLVAFRDRAGKVGVMDHRCPHRGASLVLGRNEEDGLRCVYHGWKFDVAGRCLDTPNVAIDSGFRDNAAAKAYSVHETAGLIWVYMGPQDRVPPFPSFEVLRQPESEIRVLLMQRECNWLQALEGDIDSSHLGFLHTGGVTPEDLGEEHPAYFTVKDRIPNLDVVATDWGTSCGAFRRAADGRIAWRVNNFIFPFFTQTAQTRVNSFCSLSAWVPLDDTHTMLIRITCGEDEAAHTFAPVPMKDGTRIPGTEPERLLPNSTDWYGRYRAADDWRNDWGIDRELQRSGKNYSGIAGVNLQDQAVTESMGPISDHTIEHLTPSDVMIAVSRRRLLAAARAYAKSGALPPSQSDADSFLSARAGTFVAAEGDNWQDVLASQPAFSAGS